MMCTLLSDSQQMIWVFMLGIVVFFKTFSGHSVRVDVLLVMKYIGNKLTYT